MSERAPHEHPEGFEIRRRPHEVSPDAERPGWLVGPEADVREGAPDPYSPDHSAQATTPPASDERRTSWAPSASSVPRLKLVASAAGAAAGESAPEGESETQRPKLDPPSKEAGPARLATRLPKPLEEPWWLVWAERIASDPRLWVSGLLVLALVAGVTLWRGRANAGASLATIKRHAPTFEGRAVRVRGRVGEVFAIGQGHVFFLHQGRDTVVVFSATRRPAIHQRVVVNGKVSTGYLDGVPRVAIFESQ
jgi:hypothetical protein